MRCLVTGGAGFIGSHLVDVLVRRGDSVRVLDDLSTGHIENLDVDSVEFRHETVEVFSDCVRACRDIDCVFHQAAIPSVPRSVEDPITSHGANATGTLNMLIAAKACSVRRFVYAASSSVYGDTLTMPKVETMPAKPMSPYAAQKHLGELYCWQAQALYGLETVALRYFNIFGPRQDPNSPYGGVIPKFISALLRCEPPVIHGDGEQSRDFTYIDNAVSANLLAADADKSACGRSYNIGCGERYSLNELLARLQRILGTDIEPEHAGPRPGDVRDSMADIRAAGDAFSYYPKVDFNAGLEITANSYARKHYA